MAMEHDVPDGIDAEVLAAITGGTVVERGTGPTRTRTLLFTRYGPVVREYPAFRGVSCGPDENGAMQIKVTHINDEPIGDYIRRVFNDDDE